MSQAHVDYEKAGCLSRCFFSWLTPMFKIASKRNLTFNDLIATPKSEEAQHLTQKLTNEWTKETKKPLGQQYFHRAMLRFLKLDLLIYAALQICDTIFLTIKPLLIGWIIGEFSKADGGDISVVSMYTALLILAMFASVLLRNQQFYYGSLTGMRLRIASTGLVFNKVLTLDQKSLAHSSFGQIFNLLSTDVRRFENVRF
ncbi:Multidrug resistance-associated protein 4 [Cichlidogyrus casuarinus]|uniref:Multidrug resistance-associated protein 4 n=1 Tax=Cichlidogyrus casuarinus TaxID=1844966 RepID=A0ABD2PU35_9PLAT